MTATLDRRSFVAAALAAATRSLAASDDGRQVIDTHQHLWDLSKFTLPWLTKGTPLARSFTPDDYAAAIKGLPITKSVYLEVDVAPEQHDAEADYVAALCASGKVPTKAAVIGGRPEDEAFAKYAKRFKDHGSVRGVRRVLHGGTPAGHCLSKTFVRNVQTLGELGLHFEFCVRHAELPDCAKLADECPGTRFVLDHCGNPDLKKHERWKKDLAELAKRKNVMACKVSGIVASAEPGWTADDLAPVVNHTLETFGPERVMFGSDWPVCLKAATITKWLGALEAIVKDRKAADTAKLFHDNAARVYRI